MRWSYILMGAVVVTAGVVSAHKLLDLPRHAFQGVVAALVAVVIVSLFGFVSRLRE